MSAKSYATFYNQASSIWHDEHNKGKRMIMAKKGTEQYKAIKVIEAKIRSGEIPSKVVKRVRKKKAAAVVAAPVAPVTPVESAPPPVVNETSAPVQVYETPKSTLASIALPARQVAKMPTVAKVLGSQDASMDAAEAPPIVKKPLSTQPESSVKEQLDDLEYLSAQRKKNRKILEKLSK